MAPGDAVPARLSQNVRPLAMQKRAVLSDDARYRYALWREWDPSRGVVLFLGLNPSIADDVNDDPTLRRCIGFASRWGFGGVCLGNLFGYRATKPGHLKSVNDPIGPDNDKWILRLDRQAQLTVAAWGNHGTLLGRDSAVTLSLNNLYCLGKTKQGAPRHPLYVSYSVRYTAFTF